MSKSLLKSFQIFSQLTALIQLQTKDHSNVSPAEWTSVPTLMHCLRERLAETLISTGSRAIRGSSRLIRHTSHAAVVGCPCCGNFRRNCSILWRCLISRLCFILVCTRRRRHRSLLEDDHSTLQCWRPCCDSWRPRTASVYTRCCHSD